MNSTELPAIAEPHLVRPRLHRLLDEGVQRPVTTVQAGPGWGKTTLASGWAGSQPQPVAWLTLQRRHATAPAFCSGVAAALQGAFPPASVPGRFGHVADEAGLRRLAAGFGRPVPLVLDDLQAIEGSPALRVLAALIRRQPTALRFVLIGRRDPDLPLQVPRASGGLFPISTADLRFDEREAAALIARLRPEVKFSDGSDPASSDRIATITKLAEGWPLGLRLAAGSLDADPGEVIGDYLSREVIAGQSAAIRRFLLRTSIVDEVSPELADVLTGTPGSRRILTALERATGLVSGYRYHGQLRAELRRGLDREAPDEVAELHRRAARWYAGARMIPQAVRHAAEAGDWDYLSRLVVTLAPGMSLSPKRAEFIRAIQQIPPELLPTTTEFVLCAVMLALDAGDLRALPDLLQQARELLHGRSPADRLAADIVIDIIDASAVLRISGDMPAMVAATDRITERTRVADPRALPIAQHVRVVATIMKGIGLIWTLRIHEARQHLIDGMTEARALGMPLTAVSAEGHLALLAFFDGTLGEAERLACAAYRQAEQLGATGTVQSTSAYLALALVEVERDRLTEGQAVLRNAQRAEADPPESTLSLVSVLVRAHLALAGGDHAAAAAVLRQAREERGPTLRAPLLERWMDLVEDEIFLAAGQARRVTDRLRRLDQPSPAEQVVLGRALIAIGDRTGGEELLRRIAAGTDPLAACSAWIVIALEAEARGDTARSAAAAARAVAIAEPEGIRRPFRVLGAEHLLRSEVVLDPLSERELEVLRYLPSVLTANEIAEELGVSVNTIKAHLRSIYRKLGAARRREAVDRAAQAGLL
ncbi:LuxR C-terminal-related transcriptional regulator [Actinoplanes sp. OR16]|uniref:helix-turn-helix transcriptional regulator n=1 Tax=Actinoplanes sp. OR16 TaxID=946334 RepID=UPI00135F18D5|nr:LuxR C-terminal-related transcriptional regulator [Actinoplanes sp. OR16]